MYDPTVGRWISQDPLGPGPLSYSEYKYTRGGEVSTGVSGTGVSYVDPATKQWMSTDSRYGSGDSNLYRYVKNSPVTNTDPSGLLPPGTQLPNSRFWPSTEKHSLTLTINVDFDFQNKVWNGVLDAWTPGRRTKFITAFSQEVEDVFNNNPFQLVYKGGEFSRYLRPQIQVVYTGKPSAATFTYTVFANSGGNPFTSSADVKGTTGELDEDDVALSVLSTAAFAKLRPFAKPLGSDYSFPIPDQIIRYTAPHELGHNLGLDHPGQYLDPPRESNKVPDDYYADPFSLMGAGTLMRGMYFERWQNYLNSTPKWSSYGTWFLTADSHSTIFQPSVYLWYLYAAGDPNRDPALPFLSLKTPRNPWA